MNSRPILKLCVTTRTDLRPGFSNATASGIRCDCLLDSGRGKAPPASKCLITRTRFEQFQPPNNFYKLPHINGSKQLFPLSE
ncbi:hypothetical protein TNCV_3338761 [Trichonephila clavipes]|nr:hypothetical protein TNCV_3338761 [Trichonephila clavipes]